MNPVTHPTAEGQKQTLRALRLSKVLDRTGLSRTQIYRLIKAGGFPAPIKLSTAISAWDEAAIDAWLAEKFSGAK